MVLPLVFITVFSLKGEGPSFKGGEGFSALILYTWLAFLAISVPTLYFYFKKNIWGVRIGFALNLITSLPTRAAITIVLSVIAIFISFSPSVKNYMKL